MEKRIRQCVGIDCGLKELVVSFGVMDENFEQKILSNTQFKNQSDGFKKLLNWSKKLNPGNEELTYVIEATGVYHEKAALFLHQQGCQVIVLLPNRAKAFARTLSVKTSNDKVSAQMLAQFGLEKKLEPWQPPQEIYNHLRQLTRERDQLVSERTGIKNQMHAELHGAWVNQASVKRMKQRLKLLAKQIEEIEEEISVRIENEPSLKEKVEIICTIKGVQLLTAATVLAETNGFNLIRNKKQLVSYAGLDVVERTSGTSVRGKTRISGKGNKYLRKALYFPSLSAIRSEKTMQNLFKRLVGKHGIKMKAAVAVQRKLLELIYVLWKKNEVFDPEYLLKKEQPRRVALTN